MPRWSPANGPILAIFEETFNHRAFTGRSGTFFAYEGLGSIYWHMVAKLLLAVQEVYQQAIAHGEDEAIISALAEHYYDIRAGLGYEKSPEVYGAFPTDPYSHTPWGAGAKQPGMTGQVKEELLTRWGELGVLVHEGQIASSRRCCGRRSLWRNRHRLSIRMWRGRGKRCRCLPTRWRLPFAVCRWCMFAVTMPQVAVHLADGTVATTTDMGLDKGLSQELFGQSGVVTAVVVTIPHM
jgi:hypothetical protein